MKSNIINSIIWGDALKVLPQLDKDSIDLVLTDPPYFLDKLDSEWDPDKVSKLTDYCVVVKSLPPGMKFDRNQGRELYNWFYKVSKLIYEVLKPGGFFFSFSSPRLYHRMVSAADDAGFNIRDALIWLYTQNQPKAMSLNHFIRKLRINDNEKELLIKQFSGWKTPQLKVCYEPIMMAQKPYEGTFLENMMKYKVGLINTNVKIGDNMFPSNVVSSEKIYESLDRCILVSKPSKMEKGEYNDHRTVKPLALCEYIILLTTYDEEAIVLDPFVGSGTTAVAAKKLGRKFIGIDINKQYVEISQRRLEELDIGDKEELVKRKHNQAHSGGNLEFKF